MTCRPNPIPVDSIRGRDTKREWEGSLLNDMHPHSFTTSPRRSNPICAGAEQGKGWKKPKARPYHTRLRTAALHLLADSQQDVNNPSGVEAQCLLTCYLVLLALGALEVNAKVAEDTELLGDMHDNYVYGTLAQKTKMECHRPGSLSQLITHGVEFKARARLGEVRFKTAVSLQLRKPVLCMICIAEAHSDDEHSSSESRVREKPGRNPIIAQFFREELDPEAEVYCKRNMKKGQREPKTHIRTDPLLQASPMGTFLPDDVPVNFFTPEFFNSLTLKGRARYVNTGVAFPLADFAFDEAHDDWKTMGKKEFKEMVGNDVLNLYDIPTLEEIEAIPVSDADDSDEEEEINLEDTNDEADEVQEVVVDKE
ncbi:hypothetical protein C8R45DRAFT_947782 [Mycena sanguinolenta]|nr:hypothetical protein C8R45DRAFT_947782 [Mycena sanguinolenta]